MEVKHHVYLLLQGVAKRVIGSNPASSIPVLKSFVKVEVAVLGSQWLITILLVSFMQS